MKRVIVVLTVGLLAAVALAPTDSAAKTRRPVVATWFSDLHPKVGQRLSVYAQFSSARHRIAGGRLSAVVSFGDRRLRLKGTTTNRKGIAHARFTVPKAAGGEWLRVTTTVVYKGHRYAGSNRVKVAS